jgi:AcrR family transcriptional regulator
MAVDLDGTQTSRARLLASAKMLMAHHGYEQASTAAIAREAATSESQLMRYFGGKAGLLEAVFNSGWAALNEKIQRNLASVPTARGAIMGILSGVMSAFEDDAELAFLFMFEGRRLRGAGPEIGLSKGFREFSELLRQLVRRGKLDGSFDKSVNEYAAASALEGAAEGLIRDRLIEVRSGRGAPYSDAVILAAFESMLDSIAAPAAHAASR